MVRENFVRYASLETCIFVVDQMWLCNTGFGGWFSSIAPITRLSQEDDGTCRMRQQYEIQRYFEHVEIHFKHVYVSFSNAGLNAKSAYPYSIP